jgi:hypothetical protein
MRWAKWLKDRCTLPFRAPAIVYIQRDRYVLSRRRWFRSTEALEQYIAEETTREIRSSRRDEHLVAGR